MDTKQPSDVDDVSLYRMEDLMRKGSFSKGYLYKLMARNQFPKPALVLGPKFTRWAAEECNQWFANPTLWIQTHSNDTSKGT